MPWNETLSKKERWHEAGRVSLREREIEKEERKERKDKEEDKRRETGAADRRDACSQVVCDML